MSFCFIMASVTGREHMLNDFIKSAKASKYADCEYYLYFQDIDGAKKTGAVDYSFFADVHTSKTRDGVCLPRMFWLHELDNYDFYIVIDDDMEFLGKEDYESMMNFAGSIRECGLCCSDCRRTLKLYNEFPIEKVFKKNNLEWISGGAVIKKEVRDLLVREIDLKPYTYDAFCLVTYINGYTNYQYQGSCSLHKAGQKDGFAYTRKNSDQFVTKFEKYIIDPFKKNGKLTLPYRESELTEEARVLHQKNRK